MSAGLATARSRTDLLLSSGLLLGTLALLAYVFLVEVPVYVHLPASVESAGGVAVVAASRRGTVEARMATEGALVAAGEVLFVIDHDGGESAAVHALLTAQRDELRTRLDSTRAALAAVTGEHADAQAGRLSLATMETQLSQALTEADGRLLTLESRRQTTLRAPRAGRIVDARIGVGMLVNEGQALAAIVDEVPVFQIRAQVPAEDIARLHAGADVLVSLGDGDRPRQVPGNVRDIDTLPQPARLPGQPALHTVTIVLAADAEPPPLAQGMPASVRVLIDRRSVIGWVLRRFAEREEPRAVVGN